MTTREPRKRKQTVRYEDIVDEKPETPKRKKQPSSSNLTNDSTSATTSPSAATSTTNGDPNNNNTTTNTDTTASATTTTTTPPSEAKRGRKGGAKGAGTKKAKPNHLILETPCVEHITSYEETDMFCVQCADELEHGAIVCTSPYFLYAPLHHRTANWRITYCIQHRRQPLRHRHHTAPHTVRYHIAITAHHITTNYYNTTRA